MKHNPLRAAAVFLRNYFNRDALFYGGVEFTFWAAFAAVAFTSAHLAQVGFASSTVGVIMALVSVAGIIASPIIGDISDKIGSPRKMFMVCAVISSVFYLVVPMLLDVRVAGVSVGVIFILLWSFFSRPMQGLCEGWVVSAADQKRTFTFGSVRYYGSVSYAVVCMIFGRIANHTGSQAFTFPAYGLLCLPILALCLFARGDDHPVEKRQKATHIGVRAAVKNYYLIMFLICHCFIRLPMNCTTTFVPYKLLEIAGETSALGLLTGIRALAEIPLLLFGSKIVKKIGIKNLFVLDIALFGTAQVLFATANSIWQLTLAMFLMGSGYGAHLLGQVNYVYRITPKEAAASAQSLAVSFAMAAAVIGYLVGGVLVDALGTSGLFWFMFALEVASLVMFLGTFPLGRWLGKEEPDLSHIV